MLKEANDPTRQANQRARTDDDGPPLLAVDNRLVIPQGKVVKFIVTANDVIHSFAVPAFWIKHGRDPGPASTRPGPRSTARASISASARNCAAPAMASCRSRSRWFRRHSSPQWVASNGGHMPGAKPAAPASSSPAAPAVAQAGGNASRGPARSPTARSPTARDRAELRAKRVLDEHHRRLAALEAARGA